MDRVSEKQDGLTTLITGGLGAALGGIITAIVQVMSRAGESRATAAELVTRAASTLVEQLQADNERLRERIAELENEDR